MGRRIPLGLKVGAAVVALIVGSIGLAYAAGLELPDQAGDKATEATTTVEKPDQSEDDDRRMGSREGVADSSVADDVRAVIEDRDEGGCEFGQAVAESARANSQGEDPGAEDACDHDVAQASDAGNEGKDEAAKEREPKGSRDTGVDHARSDDDEDVDEDADEDKPEREDKSVDGEEKSEGASAGGQSHRPDDDDDE